MKNKSRKMLPKKANEIENGGVYQQAVRCGKKGCRCASGDLHEGYYYFIRRVGGRLRKSYVPKQHVDRIVSLVEQARQNRQIERATRLTDRELLSQLRGRLREYEPLIRNLADLLKYNG